METVMSRLYGPIDREVQVVEMRQIRMLQRLETNRLIAQAREENGGDAHPGTAWGLDWMRNLMSRAVGAKTSRSTMRTEGGAAG